MPRREVCAAKRERSECLECPNDALPNGAYCFNCLQRMNARNTKHKESHRDILAKKERNRRKWRRENHRCQRCGGPLDPNEIDSGLASCGCENDKHDHVYKNHPY